MKLLKWALGGASAYMIFRYSIGRKAKGEDVFPTPEKDVGEAPSPPRSSARKAPAPAPETPPVEKPRPKRRRKPPQA